MSVTFDSEFEQFESQYNNLMNSKTQRELILNSNELLRTLEKSSNLEAAAKSVIDPGKLQPSQAKKYESISIKEMIPTHYEMELFAARDRILNWHAVDEIYNNCLHLRLPVHIKYWTLYKVLMILESETRPEMRNFLKQFVRVKKTVKKYTISSSYIDLLSRLIENEKNGITDKTEEIIKLEEKTLLEMQIAYDKFKKHLENENPQTNATSLLLQRFPYAKQDGIESSWGLTGGLCRGICIILHFIASDATQESLDFVGKFAVVKKNGYIDKFTFAPSFYEYEKETLRVERMQESDFETSWNYVVFPYELLTNREGLVKRKMENGEGLSAMVCNSMYNELIDLIDSKKDKMDNSKYPDLVEGKIHATKVFGAIKREFEAQTQQELETEKFLDSGFNHNTSVLRVAAIDMPIEKNSYRDYMLKEMFNFDESVVLSEDYITTETHSYDDIYEAYTADEISKATASDSSKTEDQMIAQKKGYEAFRGLRKRCKDAMGQKDVFIGTKTTIKANPKYFRVQKNNNA